MDNIDIQKYICDNWGKRSLLDIEKELNTDLYEILKFAYENELYTIETTNIVRYWTNEEDRFLSDYANQLTTKKAANLLFRSRYAVYQHVKCKDLTLMIKARNK